MTHSEPAIVCRFVPAEEASALAELMRDYYAFDSHAYDPAAVAGTLGDFLRHPEYGRAWFIEVEGAVAGYMVLCIGFSLEFGGRDAFVDEIYLREAYRRQGIGRRALEIMIGEAQRLGLKALHLEVDRANTTASHLYRKLGFTPRDRFMLMSRAL
jgi:ribosomal protein S18 acetylase RimI-like enzyme